jgi:hypothetical protein
VWITIRETDKTKKMIEEWEQFFGETWIFGKNFKYCVPVW